MPVSGVHVALCQAYNRVQIALSWAVVAHAFNPSTWEAEAGGFLRSRPAWSTEFQDSQGYTEKPCLEKQKNKNNKQTNKQKGGQEQRTSEG
jgi:hypothetical protein